MMNANLFGRLAWVLVSIGLPAATLAAQNAVVEGVQNAAWVERGAVRTPLMVGMELKAQDRISTGGNSRALIKMREGSLVKLGENGQLKINTLEQKPAKSPVFAAAFEVLEGAFRFTTLAIGRRNTRDVTVQIATITAGIRGTDLWGKASSERDLICLLEGKISVTRSGDAPVLMSDPLTFFTAPKGGPAEGVQPAPKDKLPGWVEETDIGASKGALRKGGKWKLVLIQGADEDRAFEVYNAARAAGFPAELHPQGTDKKRSYLVRLGQIASEADAKVLNEQLSKALQLSATRITH